MIYKHKQHYQFVIDDISKIDRIRIIPATRGGVNVKLTEFRIFQEGFQEVNLFRNKEYENLVPEPSQIREFNSNRQRVQFNTKSGTAQLQWILPRPEPNSSIFLQLFRLLLFVGLVFYIYKHVPTLAKDHWYVVYGLVVALVLILVMAAISKPHAHPDEHVHIRAAVYYSHNSLPAAVCDADTRGTYSVYGTSRLNSNEIYYYAAGHMLRLISFIPIKDYRKLRYINVFLFLLIVIAAIKLEGFRLFSLPLLFSPQLWYLFSYVNSEAFSIFVVIFAAYQVFYEQSTFRRAFRSENFMSRVTYALLFGGFLGLSFLLKKSFYFSIAYIGLVILIYLVLVRKPDLIRPGIRRLLPIAVVAAVIYGGVELMHQATNDFERSARISLCAKTLATRLFSPVTPPEKTAETLYWRDKGRPFSDLWEADWGTKVFISGFGYYGYFYAPGGELYYDAIKIILSAFLLYLFFWLIYRGDALAKASVIALLVAFAGLVAITMWNAWTKDFQPQGRYFFSMVMMLGCILHAGRSTINPYILFFTTVAMFTLSAFSYLFIGIIELPKQ